MKNKTKKLTTVGIFSAIICIVTTFIAVPAPSIGNINLGDLFILCSAWLLGPIYGALASGIGAFLADILSGYALYAPATLVIKMTVAFTCYHTYTKMFQITKRNLLSLFLGAICAEAIMISGYFLYEWIIYDITSAISSIPFNAIQAITCAISGVIVFKLVSKNKRISDFRKSFISI